MSLRRCVVSVAKKTVNYFPLRLLPMLIVFDETSARGTWGGPHAIIVSRALPDLLYLAPGSIYLKP